MTRTKTPATGTVQYLDTTQLRCGDVILNHGMRIVLDQPRSVVTHPDREVVHFSGKVLNPDDVRGDSLLWSFLHTDEWDQRLNRWVNVFTGRFAIQGNSGARWTVESRCDFRDEMHPDSDRCLEHGLECVRADRVAA